MTRAEFVALLKIERYMIQWLSELCVEARCKFLSMERVAYCIQNLKWHLIQINVSLACSCTFSAWTLSFWEVIFICLPSLYTSATNRINLWGSC